MGSALAYKWRRVFLTNLLYETDPKIRTLSSDMHVAIHGKEEVSNPGLRLSKAPDRADGRGLADILIAKPAAGRVKTYTEDNRRANRWKAQKKGAATARLLPLRNRPFSRILKVKIQ